MVRTFESSPLGKGGWLSAWRIAKHTNIYRRPTTRLMLPTEPYCIINPIPLRSVGPQQLTVIYVCFPPSITALLRRTLAFQIRGRRSGAESLRRQKRCDFGDLVDGIYIFFLRKRARRMCDRPESESNVCINENLVTSFSTWLVATAGDGLPGFPTSLACREERTLLLTFCAPFIGNDTAVRFHFRLRSDRTVQM